MYAVRAGYVSRHLLELQGRAMRVLNLTAMARAEHVSNVLTGGSLLLPVRLQIRTGEGSREVTATKRAVSHPRTQSGSRAGYLRSLGPGRITGASDDDPSGVA